jgi:hypothetical protein
VVEAGEAGNDADGVLVVSAWTQGPRGGLLARVTMSSKDSTSVVRVAASPDDLHAVIDEWLASLDA